MRKDAKRLTALLMVLSMLLSFVPTMRTQAADNEETGSETTVSYTNEVDVTLYVGEFATFEVNAAAASTEINSSIATAEIGDAYDAQLGTDANYDGDYINLEEALYTFTYSESESGWIISNTISDETTVYVNIDNSANGYPNNETVDVLTLTWNSSYFTITNGSGRNLAFLTNSTTPYFDEGNFGVTPTTSANEGYAKLLIYCPVADGETDSEELPGYVEVTSLEGIASGSRYLIVAYRNEAYYVLYPSTSTSSKFAHVAKALGTVQAQMTVTGVATGTTSVVVGDTLYKITVPVTAGTDTKILEGGDSETLDITDIDSSFALAEDSTVTWTIGDTDVASLYSTSGASTSLVAHAAGVTNVIAKVYDASGNLTAVYVWTITVNSTYGAGAYTYIWTVGETVYNGTLYYSVDGGELIEATLNEETTDTYGNTIRTYTISYTRENVQNTGLIYFIKPDDGYATTYVYDDGGNTHSQFYGAKTLPEFYSSDAYLEKYPDVNHSGGWPTDVMSNAEWDALTAQAIAVGCDAVYWNTRTLSESTRQFNYTGSYTNYCNKLPTVEKKITSLTRSGETVSYEEGTTEVKVGDVINYTVSITTYYETADIVYENVLLTDTMSSGSGTAATFEENSETTMTATDKVYSSDVQTATDAIAASYTVNYTVTQEDLDSELLNTVSLSYDYSTSYGTGSYGGTASAACRVNLVSSFTPDSVVVDFDLPVTVDYSATDAHGSYNLVSGTATYGEVTIEDNKVTYTPKSVLTGVDTVTLVNEKNATYTFDVYPATTVYYEESFASYGSGWDLAGEGNWSFTDSNSESGTVSQQAHKASDENTTFNNYNYDAAYASDASGSGGTAATTTTKGDTLSFTFTGTGVDIFANCDSGSGRVTIRLTDSNGAVKQFLFVDMANSGTYGTGDSTTAYNTPIASISGLDYGSYTVDIYLAGTGTSGFQFDGFRVYDTIEQSKTKSTDACTVQTEVYQDDDEDYPDYYELRNSVLAGVSADTSTSTYKEDLTNTLAQVYATGETGDGAIVVYDTSSQGIMLTDTTAQDILDNGPKNELYLYPGTAVVFKVTTSRKVQVGMRSVTGVEVSYSVSAVDSDEQRISIAGTTSNGTMTSSVDMFYDLVAKSSTETTYVITIQNTGSAGILSITDIKISDSSDSAVFEELTTEEVVAALESSSASEETQADADEADGMSEETETDTGGSGSATEETGTTNTDEENDASEEIGTDTGEEDSASEETETDTGEEDSTSEETETDTGGSGSASEETGTTNTDEENDASEETDTGTGKASGTSEVSWTVTDELSGAVARAAQKTGASAFSVLGLSFDSAYTGEVTLSVAEYAQGDKVLLLQPASTHSSSFVLADESMIDEDGNVTFTVTDCTIAMLVMGLNGDVNGDGTVDTKDLHLIRRELCKNGTLTEAQQGFADYNLNGTLEAWDLLAMTLYVDGKAGTSR